MGVHVWQVGSMRVAGGPSGKGSFSGVKPALPLGSKHWSETPEPALDLAGPGPKRSPAKAKARPKTSGADQADKAAPSYPKKAADPFYGDARSGGSPQNDPLNLKQPPRGGDRSLDLIADGYYGATGLNPDSLSADVEALLAQERMLAEQTKWWEMRAKRESSKRQSLQAQLQGQEATFKQEAMQMQREFANAREQQLQEEAQRSALVKETSALRSEVASAQEKAELLRRRLEEVAKTTSPDNSAKIRDAIASVSSSLVPRASSPRDTQVSKSPTVSATPAPSTSMASGRPGQVPGQSGKSFLGDVRPSPKAAVPVVDNVDFDDGVGFLGGGPGGSNLGTRPIPSGLTMDFSFGEDEDDDLDMDDLGFG